MPTSENGQAEGKDFDMRMEICADLKNFGNFNKNPKKLKKISVTVKLLYWVRVDAS